MKKQLISLLLLFCIALPVTAQQQSSQKTNKQPTADVDTIPLYNGTYIGVDLYGLGSKLFGSDFISSEVDVGVNFKNRYIPMLEVGMGGTDYWNDNGIHYKSSAAPFFRIGMDYNTMAKKQEQHCFLYVGLRYAFTSFKYDVSTMPVSDPLWGDAAENPNITDGYWQETIPYNHLGMKASMQWAELVVGVKVRIYKNFNMGWSVRAKFRVSVSTDKYADPAYIPGFGAFKANNLGIVYSLIYRLPL